MGLIFDEKRQVTTLTVEGMKLEPDSLAGRVIQVGGAYGVVRSNDRATISVWGNMKKPLQVLAPETPFRRAILEAYRSPDGSVPILPDDRGEIPREWLAGNRPALPESEFEIFPTYQLQPGSPAKGLGATSPSPVEAKH